MSLTRPCAPLRRIVLSRSLATSADPAVEATDDDSSHA